MPYSKEVYKGRFTPINYKKYIGDTTNIVYRSSYELKFMKWCDLNDSILQWNSEEIVIPYLNPLDNKIHRYFVDFAIKVKTKTGDIKKYLIEVKPYRFTQPPQMGKRKSKQYLQEVMQYEVNQNKWKFASAYAQDKGWEFMILTEKDLGIQ